MIVQKHTLTPFSSYLRTSSLKLRPLAWILPGPDPSGRATWDLYSDTPTQQFSLGTTSGKSGKILKDEILNQVLRIYYSSVPVNLVELEWYCYLLFSTACCVFDGAVCY